MTSSFQIHREKSNVWKENNVNDKITSGNIARDTILATLWSRLEKKWNIW